MKSKIPKEVKQLRSLKELLRKDQARNDPDSDDSDEEDEVTYFNAGQRSIICKHLDDYVNMVIYSWNQNSSKFHYYFRIDTSEYTP